MGRGEGGGTSSKPGVNNKPAKGTIEKEEEEEGRKHPVINGLTALKGFSDGAPPSALYL